ncbi:hypothetical protein ACH5RR_013281 [Cinchona calisaya]|uniref:Glycosyltransferase n=1 Tax=Cinchona calisaya TaxID=153742 RepID=A0ABD2ZZK5_9GENT
MAEKSSLHVALFPWLAFGHIIPYLELSKFILQKGHKVTFISTPRNIHRLPKIPPDLASSITFLKIPLPQVEGLPQNAEATLDVRTQDIPFLKKAYDGLEPDLTHFLENSLPDWIVYDFSAYWLPPIATKLGISKAFFSILSASSRVFFGPSDFAVNGTDPRKKAEDFKAPPQWVPFQTKVAYKSHEINWIMGAGQVNESGISDMYRYGTVAKGSDVIFVRHCYEFEGQWLNLLNELEQKPVIPVGLMPPKMEEGSSHDNNESWVLMKEWLDGLERASVVYIAFGSEVSLSQQELSELALGLELSKVPFFWCLRKPPGSTEFSSFELPNGFEERIRGRGFVWKSWAPQLKILSHESIGGFLTHCGWSSSIEGLMFGHPLIMLPFVIDTGLVARVLEDKQVGVEVLRNEQDGSYTRNSVADSVRLVMVENSGKVYREKAKEICEIFGDRDLHDGYIRKVIDYLENNGRRKSG